MSTAGVVALTLAALMVLTVIGGLAAYAIADRLMRGTDTPHPGVTPLSTSSSDHQHSSQGAHQR